MSVELRREFPHQLAAAQLLCGARILRAWLTLQDASIVSPITTVAVEASSLSDILRVSLVEMAAQVARASDLGTTIAPLIRSVSSIWRRTMAGKRETSGASQKSPSTTHTCRVELNAKEYTLKTICTHRFGSLNPLNGSEFCLPVLDVAYSVSLATDPNQTLSEGVLHINPYSRSIEGAIRISAEKSTISCTIDKSGDYEVVDQDRSVVFGNIYASEG